MKIIAHRANFDGPNIENENSIYSIKKCIELDYDIEIDVRFKKGELYLGHDEPKQIIETKYLLEIKDKTWIHCKNLEAISFFNKINEKFNYFWHENDSYTLTSEGYIWAYPGKKLSPGCICVMPENTAYKNNFNLFKKIKISGICTDYPKIYQ